MASDKTGVIEMLFNDLWIEESRKLRQTTVTMTEVGKAIERWNLTAPANHRLSTRNPANFLKDVKRTVEGANRAWPQSVFERGYNGRQSIGDEGSFEFIPIPPDQEVPFLEPFLTPDDVIPNHFEVETLSIGIAVKKLGREDESFLVQALVNVRAIESHFALTSDRKVEQVDFLQTNVKLGHGEVDALFLLSETREVSATGPAEYPSPGLPNSVIATCEVKGRKEIAWPDQILRQVKAFLESEQGHPHEIVVPLYVKALGGDVIRIVEMKEISRPQLADLQDSDFVIVAESLVTLKPSIPGLNSKPTSPGAK